MGMLRAVTAAFLATLAVGALSGPAGADGPPPDRPYRHTPYETKPVPGFFDFNWSGFYVGGHLGGGHINIESNETVNALDPLLLDTLTYGQDAASVVGGVQAGWQKQWEKFVAGVELTYTALSFDETTPSPLLLGVTRSADLHDLLTLTGRLGYADGRWLAYAKGGWASADIGITYRDALTGAVASSSGRESGWTAGLGIDYALSHHLFLGIEYNYLAFRADVAPLPIPDTGFRDAHVDIQTLVVRLNYRLGHWFGP
jgi:outer membrane immunogenic protein